MKTLVWFRGKDLRIADHPPLAEAAQKGETIPVFVLDPYFFSPEQAKELPHRMQFLLQSLEALKANLQAKGSDLVIFGGKSTRLIPELAARFGVDQVVAHRWTEPFGQKRDAIVAERLRVPFVLYEGETMAAPGEVLTQQGQPFSVFTPFSRQWRKVIQVRQPLPVRVGSLPKELDRTGEVAVPTLAALGIEANESLLHGGERAGRDRLTRFVKRAERYHVDRDRMDMEGTSRLSVDLKFGTVSARTVWNEANKHMTDPEALFRFQTEVLWREFSHHVLYTRPHVLTEPFRPAFKGFPWENDEVLWRAWCEGKTGYPVVDASARQLLGEGYVHNRARMISASFLTKDLCIDYRRGEGHYMKHLTDGDWAQNNLGWQWATGCGCDAQPYFRIFNPITQGEKFDPDGGYVRKWVPELAKMPAKHIHSPWEAPAAVLAAAGVRLGTTYPMPIVEHRVARDHFLRAAKAHFGSAEPPV